MIRTPYGFDLQSFETSLACNLAAVPWVLWTFASKPWVRPGDISRYALVAYRVRCPEGLLQGSTWFRPARWSVCGWISTVCAVSTAVKLRRHPLVFGHHRRGTRCRIFRGCRWIATRCRLCLVPQILVGVGKTLDDLPNESAVFPNHVKGETECLSIV